MNASPHTGISRMTMRSDIAAIDDARQPHAGKDAAVASPNCVKSGGL